MLPAEYHNYHRAFVTLNRVVESCFGIELSAGYEQCLKEFEDAYMALGLNVTPKAHLLFSHAIEDICKHGQGLGLFNEAAAESIHSDFDKFYQRYTVKDIRSPSYITKLQSAVTPYNARHI